MAVAQTPRGDQHGPVVDASKARGGQRGFQLLWVLVISFVLVGIGFLALLAIQGPALSGPGGQVTTDRPTINAPLLPAKQKAPGPSP